MGTIDTRNVKIGDDKGTLKPPLDPQRKDVMAPPPRNIKRLILRWVLTAFASVLIVFLIYRWVGTTTYRGSVQRVYETGVEYRIEFSDQRGGTHVVSNQDMRFPYFKLDTADLHAELNRLATTGDIVDLKVWGFRHSWFSAFPNAVSVTLIETAKARNRRIAESVADSVISALKNKGALVEGVEVRDVIVDAVERTQQVQEKRERPE